MAGPAPPLGDYYSLKSCKADLSKFSPKVGVAHTQRYLGTQAFAEQAHGACMERVRQCSLREWAILLFCCAFVAQPLKGC